MVKNSHLLNFSWLIHINKVKAFSIMDPTLRTKKLHVLMKNIPYVYIFSKIKIIQQ